MPRNGLVNTSGLLLLSTTTSRLYDLMLPKELKSFGCQYNQKSAKHAACAFPPVFPSTYCLAHTCVFPGCGNFHRTCTIHKKPLSGVKKGKVLTCGLLLTVPFHSYVMSLGLTPLTTIPKKRKYQKKTPCVIKATLPILFQRTTHLPDPATDGLEILLTPCSPLKKKQCFV